MFYEDVMLGMCSSKASILQQVDEYTLYCDYLGFEPELSGLSYPSPLREGDDTPSFGVFYSKHRVDVEFMWKDHAYTNGKRVGSGISGDIFDLVGLLFGYTSLSDILAHIQDDYNLGKYAGKRERVIKHTAPTKINYQIAVKSRPMGMRDLSYWQQFNVNRALLEEYNTTAVQCYWMVRDQKSPSYPRDLCYAYRIHDRYQIYKPFAEKRKKFRNNWLENYIPGLAQLKRVSDTLIITKAYKDVMTFASFGFESVASRGEDIPLPEGFIEYAKQHYKRIITWQDNDGKTGVEKYYPTLSHYTCPGSPATGDPKDISDYCKRYGPDKTLDLINSTIW